MNKKKIICLTLISVFVLSVFLPINGLSDEIKKFDCPEDKISQVVQMINETMLKSYMDELLKLSPRMTGTYGSERSSEFVYDKFSEMGLDVRYHYWSAFGDIWHFAFYKDRNVEATILGSNPDEDVLIFNAHLDTVRVAPGANDDGSGVVAVLAAAKVLSQFEFNRTIKLVTFTGEEIGLRGSTEYVRSEYRKGMDLLVEFNADMIGRATTAETGKRMGISSTEDAKWIVEVAEDVNQNCGLDFEINKYNVTRDSRGYSDYKAFVDYGYESLCFWEGEHDPYMHTENDDINNVNFSYLVNTTRIIVGTLAHLADIQDAHLQINIASPKIGRLYFEDRTLYDFGNEKTVVVNNALICTELKHADNIERVEFYMDEKLMFNDTSEPYQFRLNKLSCGKHKITVIAYESSGEKSIDEKNIFYINLFRNK